MGGGLIDAIYTQMKRSDAFALPLWMSSQFGKLTISIVALLSTLISIVMGIIYINWWTGIFLWLFVDYLIVFMLRRTISLFPPLDSLFISYGFFIGIAIYIFALIKIL